MTVCFQPIHYNCNISQCEVAMPRTCIQNMTKMNASCHGRVRSIHNLHVGFRAIEQIFMTAKFDFFNLICYPCLSKC